VHVILHYVEQETDILCQQRNFYLISTYLLNYLNNNNIIFSEFARVRLTDLFLNVCLLRSLSSERFILYLMRCRLGVHSANKNKQYYIISTQIDGTVPV